MQERAMKVLTGLCLGSLVTGTVYGVSMLFPSTLISGILALSSSASAKLVAASVFVSLELLVVGMVKKSDRLALSAMLVLVVGVLLGYFVL